MSRQRQTAINRYLRELQQALTGADPTTVRTALSDAEEFLSSERDSMGEIHSLSEDEVCQRLAERFGSPADVAKEYIAADTTVAPPAASRSSGGGNAWAILIVAVALGVFAHFGSEYTRKANATTKLSPFTRVEFTDDAVLVHYDGASYEWLALDGLAVSEIVAAAKLHDPLRWQKRVAEDLVDVLDGMDHPLQSTVELRLRDAATDEIRVVGAAPMTADNRKSVWTWRQQNIAPARPPQGNAAMQLAESRRPPKLSPFTRVEFTDDGVQVEYDGQLYEWLALDGVGTDKIVAAARKRFRNLWQKRVAEDLVEVLWGMGHRPGETVELKLRDANAQTESTVAAAAMTAANRNLVRDARRRAESEAAARIASDPVGHFGRQLEERWAYFSPAQDAVNAALAKLKEAHDANPAEADLPLEFQKILANGIDGHAGFSNWELSGACLPFLIEPVGDRYVAFWPDRSGFVDPEHPYLETVDGRGIDLWRQEASVLTPRGSTQYVQRHALRNLRFIDHWRREAGLPVEQTVTVRLTDADGTDSVEKQLDTAAGMPAYGLWPRTESQLLDENIGYLRLPRMNDDAVAEIRKFLPRFRQTRGLIVDVRGNGGGSRQALRLLGSFLLGPDDSPRVVNCGKYRLHPDFSADHLEPRFMYRFDDPRWTADERRAIALFREEFHPQWQPSGELFSDWRYMVVSRLRERAVYHYRQPIVVLMDAKCFSATDIFLGALKGWPNVTLMGTSSGGGSARSMGFEVGSIGTARIASMASFQPDGRLYDSNGIAPDVRVEPAPEFFIGQGDNALEAAKEFILESAQGE